MNRLTKKSAILVIVVGVLFLAVSVFTWVRTVHYRGEGVHADAEIVDIETTYFDDDTDHTVTVRFETADGEEIEGELDAYQTGFYVGKTVPVLYLPSDPQKFTYEKNGLLLPLILGGAGVLLLGFGIYGLVRRERGYDDGTDYTPDDAEKS
ncbi:MAG: DUF3592 domain-containing protein [Clostridia bacterium]|nr:DUF3592 domain-containing protein [Clostridia bacterium]MBR5044152.1 DUF3592 domain-containing protein [Clostridia bacterium]